ncbi:hypothetical protein ATL40_2337 [Serinibacter salmoneus]|uniref:Uncharacterized protein n=1 Tax=Serinibacter salmoneus TaxID=556530 RepID=A0A2A9D205_9MICO|nr:hypothetical protein ATL40_2337 [Serinibacter salmoneus]
MPTETATPTSTTAPPSREPLGEIPDFIQKLVEQAPPLSQERYQRIAVILQGGRPRG